MKPLGKADVQVGAAAVVRAAVSAPPAWLAWAVALLAAAPALGVSYLLPTDEALLDRTPVVLYGVVGASQPAPFGDGIETDHLFWVTEVIKGSVPAGTIVVRELGGVHPDGRGMVIPGAVPEPRRCRRLSGARSPGVGVFCELDDRLVQAVPPPPPPGNSFATVSFPVDPAAASRDAVRFLSDHFRLDCRGRSESRMRLS